MEAQTEPNLQTRNNASRERVQALARLFLGRGDAYAIQQPDGSYIAVRKPLTEAVLAAHCGGKATVGTYLLLPGGRTRTGVLDLDEDTLRSRETLLFMKRCLSHFTIPSFIEPSGRKGYHLWVLLAEAVPAEKVRRLLMGVVATLPDAYRGVPIEVFPKQSVAEDLGNLVKLPRGQHRVTGHRTCFVNDKFQPYPDGGLVVLRAATLPSESDIDVATAGLPALDSPSQKRGTRIPDGPIPETKRNSSLTRMAGALRRQGASPEALEAALLQINATQCRPPLEEGEVRRIARSVGHYQPAEAVRLGVTPPIRGHRPRRIPNFEVSL